MRHGFLTLLLLACGFMGHAQTDRQWQAKESAKDYLGWKSIWLASDNPAALTVFHEVCDSAHINQAGLTADGQIGGGRPYDPAASLEAKAAASSYMKAGRAVLRGSFEYGYEWGRKSQWRGLVNPEETPFMLADSIPGSLSHETYSMIAAAAIPVGKGLSLGIETAYGTGVMAKHVDLRNRNTRMDFSVAPGLYWERGTSRFGLHADYARLTEKIEYMQVDASQEKYLYEFGGAWVYRKVAFSSAETSRMMTGFKAGATLQAEFARPRGGRLYGDISYSYRQTSQGETGYNGLRHGDSRAAGIGANLYAMRSPRTRLGFHLQSDRMYGYRFVQRQELDPDSGVRQWVTYGGPVPVYSRRTGSLAYSFEHRTESEAVEIYHRGSLAGWQEDADEGSQNLNSWTNFMYESDWRAKLNFFHAKSVISLVPRAMFRYDLCTLLLIFNKFEGREHYVAKEPFLKDIRWNTSLMVDLGAGVRWSCGGFYSGLDLGIVGSPACPKNRYSAVLSAGVFF